MVSAMAGVQKPHWTAAWRVNASAMRANARGLAEALDGRHLAAVGLHGEVGAGADRQRRRRARCRCRTPGRRRSAWRPSGPAGRAARRAAAPGARRPGPWAAPLRRSSMRISQPAARGRRAGAVDAALPGRPVVVEEGTPGTSGAAASRRPPGDRAGARPASRRWTWNRMARSRVTAVSTAQRTSSPAMTTPWLRSSAARRGPQGRRHARRLAGLGHQRRAVVVDAQAVREQDRVVGQ